MLSAVARGLGEQGHPRTAVVVMGVAGSGKSTLASALANHLGWAFGEADEMHSAANIARMSTGVPLSDEDRGPWLQTLCDWIDACPTSAVLTCSALRRSYRDLLRRANANVWFVHLDLAAEGLAARLANRTEHFMPASLLASQLTLLEPLEPDEQGVVLDADVSPQLLVETVLTRLAACGVARP